MLLCSPFLSFFLSFFLFSMMTPCQSADGKEEGEGVGGGGGGLLLFHLLAGRREKVHWYFVTYHWRELPQVSCLSRQTRVCRDKHVFVATKVCLSRQTFCRDKHIFVAASLLLSRQTCVCRDKTRLLTRQKFCVCLCSRQ